MKFRSIARAMRRGHIVQQINQTTKSIEFFRRARSVAKGKTNPQLIYLFSHPLNA